MYAAGRDYTPIRVEFKLGSRGARKMSNEKDFDEFKDRFVSDWKRARLAIEHEDNLIHHRMTWLWTSSLALFTPLVWSFTHYGEIPGQLQDPQVKELIFAVLYLIPPIGILLSVAVWGGIRAAQKQLRLIDDWWKKCLENAPEEKARHFALTGLSGSSMGHDFAIRHILPGAMTAIWSMLFIAYIWPRVATFLADKGWVVGISVISLIAGLLLGRLLRKL